MSSTSNQKHRVHAAMGRKSHIQQPTKWLLLSGQRFFGIMLLVTWGKDNFCNLELTGSNGLSRRITGFSLFGIAPSLGPCCSPSQILVTLMFIIQRQIVRQPVAMIGLIQEKKELLLQHMQEKSQSQRWIKHNKLFDVSFLPLQEPAKSLLEVCHPTNHTSHHTSSSHADANHQPRKWSKQSNVCSISQLFLFTWWFKMSALMSQAYCKAWQMMNELPIFACTALNKCHLLWKRAKSQGGQSFSPAEMIDNGKNHVNSPCLLNETELKGYPWKIGEILQGRPSLKEVSFCYTLNYSRLPCAIRIL